MAAARRHHSKTSARWLTSCAARAAATASSVQRLPRTACPPTWSWSERRVADIVSAAASSASASAAPASAQAIPRQRRVLHPPHHPQLPQPRGLQARRGPDQRGVALMDARSIAATAANGGYLTAASELTEDYTAPDYHFDQGVYDKRVYNGWGKPGAGRPAEVRPEHQGLAGAARWPTTCWSKVAATSPTPSPPPTS